MPICDGSSYRPKAFNVIATECTQVAEKLVQKLQRLKYSGKCQPWKAICRALKSVWSKNDIDALESRPNSYRQQLILQKVFAPDKQEEYASFGTRFDSLHDSNSQVLNQLAVLTKALGDMQDIQKNALSSATAIPIPKIPSTVRMVIVLIALVSSFRTMPLCRSQSNLRLWRPRSSNLSR